MDQSNWANFLIEIRADLGGGEAKVATGFLVAPDLILTARHALVADGSFARRILVRWPVVRREWAEAVVAWPDPGLATAKPDVALLRCLAPEQVRVVANVLNERPTVGRRWDSSGFAEAGSYSDDNREATPMHGVLVASPDRLIKLHTQIAVNEDDYWQGVSGSPVFVDGRWNIIGVIATCPPNLRSEVLTATPTWMLLQDPAFSALVEPERTQDWHARTSFVDEDLHDLVDRHNIFAGRREFILALNTFIQQDEKGYCLITGAAGLGKSALLTHWAQQLSQRPDINLIYCFAGWNATDEPGLIARLFESLVIANSYSVSGFDFHRSHREQLRVAVSRLEATGHRIVLIVDGLDEIVRPVAEPMLPTSLHANVKIILSTRNVAGIDWREMIGISALNTLSLELTALSASDVEDVVAHAGVSTVTTELIEKLRHESGGDPFLLRYLVEDVLAGHWKPSQSQRGLHAYLERWWQQTVNLAKSEGSSRLLAVLAAARGPLKRQDVMSFRSAGPLTDGVLFELAIASIRRFVVGDDTTGFQLCHPRFREFVRNRKMSASELKRLDDELLDYCLDWRHHSSEYAFRFLATHLMNSGNKSELMQKITPKYFQEKVGSLHSVQVALSDIDLINREALEEEDWILGLSAAIAGARIVEGRLQLPPEEVIPIYARAGAGWLAVEMATFIEAEYSRQFLLTEIADAAEASDHMLARRIRRGLWSSFERVRDARLTHSESVIVQRLAWGDCEDLVAFLRWCNPIAHKAIVDCLLKNEHTVHLIIDLPAVEVESLCARILADPGELGEKESLFVAGFDPDLERAESRVALPTARALIEARKLAHRDAPERGVAVKRALITAPLGWSSQIQLVVRALLGISLLDTIMAARQRPEPVERIKLLTEISLGLIHRKEYDQALAVVKEMVQIDKQEKCCDYFFGNRRLSEWGWVVEGLIRGIAKVDPERAIVLADSDLQRLTSTNLTLVVLWELPNYERVKEVARSINLSEWRYAHIRAKHDLAGAYEAWKRDPEDGKLKKLQVMLKHARIEEGELTMRLLREEVLPRLDWSRHETDMTALRVAIARAVADVDAQEASSLLGSIVFGTGWDSRSDLVALLPTLALAGDPTRALDLATSLDKNNYGFGAMAIAEIARLTHANLVQVEDYYLRGSFLAALSEPYHSIPRCDAEALLARPWLWINARVAVTIGRRFASRGEWGTRETFAVIVGKATAFWPEIRKILVGNGARPEDRELALCEASQWMPLDERPLIEAIQNPALAAIAWGRMARRAGSQAEREEWSRRALQVAEAWPRLGEKRMLDILCVFLEEMSEWRDPCRKLAGTMLDECDSNDLFWEAPSLLTAEKTGVFNAEQRSRVASLALKWQDWLHTFKFANETPIDDAHRLAAEGLVSLAEAWWPMDAASARECIDLAIAHASEMNAGPRRWRLQSRCIRMHADYGEVSDWKRALTRWNWGTGFLDAADAFVTKWAECHEPMYAESQKLATDWAEEVSKSVLTAL